MVSGLNRLSQKIAPLATQRAGEESYRSRNRAPDLRRFRLVHGGCLAVVRAGRGLLCHPRRGPAVPRPVFWHVVLALARAVSATW